MKSLLSGVLSIALASTLSGCAVESSGPQFYSEYTPGILYTPNYDYYTRADDYAPNTDAWYYSYGGRYEGGGYGYGAPFNH